MEGVILKGIGGFYYVKVEDKVIECKARGKFRHNELTPMVGDKVEITVNNGKGVIDKIQSRFNKLIRPAVANVTQAVVVFSAKNPEINLNLLNKILVSCEFNNLKIIVCLNKMDLVTSESEISEIADMIKSAKYELIFLKAKDNEGIDLIKDKLKDNITVFCGPSGVGKSTILNKIVGKELMETGGISEKILRGKHTTRHSELIEIDEGFIVDTPGFSSLDIQFIDKNEFQFCFPEFTDYLNLCKFRGCLHYKEPVCSVKEAVKKKKISEIRYNFYIDTLEKIMNRRSIK
ncbi:putative ribosome biogenesis GTPase RsgA [Clostridium acetireducens DSM 10703]|jgi:ribosome biogenesis GTPase|uniref:Small ribosomal subunit biogenesis GTPase RsgA n=1 Tax=Clostridium acetireducens DSM 10703 TaxID=1121290 RepID=A0A1E8F206_9CLOT|nr:ribosome small subunit-dependent GTPase A [Clostridium acetireducens]OFI07675.1 putative ribosome biogenesis GTPase RsgA [Clostridium acetireducens DSM 10703]